MSELVRHQSPLALAPQTFEQAERVAKIIAASSFAPKQYMGKPGDVLVAMMMGAEVGLAPMQALQNVAVINGRPSIWGDAALALCKAHPSYESCREWIEGEGDAMVAHCEVKRKGETLQTRSFSVSDAKKAQLWGKQGPWTQYPGRMLQMRARGFAIRDVWPDALRGLITAEEAQDYPSNERASAPQVRPQQAPREAPKTDVVEAEFDDVSDAEIELRATCSQIAESPSTEAMQELWPQICKRGLAQDETVLAVWKKRIGELRRPAVEPEQVEMAEADTREPAMGVA